MAPLSSPVELAPGVLSLDVCVSGNLCYLIELHIADLPRDPPGSRHTSESLITALEERVFRRTCFVNDVHLCGPAPRMLFGPSDPTIAFTAPQFGTATFWRRVQLVGARQTCSFEWPTGLVRTSATPGADTPSVSDRSAHVHAPSASTDLSGWLPGGSPKAGSARSRAFIAASASPGPPGTLRVHVAIGTASPETATPFDFDHNLWEVEDDDLASPQAFTRLMEIAVFERLCLFHGLQARGPAPRGLFTPSIGGRVFRRAVAARGAGCHYRVCWPAGMTRRAPLAPSTSSSFSPARLHRQPAHRVLHLAFLKALVHNCCPEALCVGAGLRDQARVLQQPPPVTSLGVSSGSTRLMK